MGQRRDVPLAASVGRTVPAAWCDTPSSSFGSRDVMRFLGRKVPAMGVKPYFRGRSSAT